MSDYFGIAAVLRSVGSRRLWFSFAGVLLGLLVAIPLFGVVGIVATLTAVLVTLAQVVEVGRATAPVVSQNQ
jgi:hypothetical protein